MTKIAAAIYCERTGQKAILIGKQGAMLKADWHGGAQGDREPAGDARVSGAVCEGAGGVAIEPRVCGGAGLAAAVGADCGEAAAGRVGASQPSKTDSPLRSE